MKKYYAHSLEGRPYEEWQLLETHLKAVAEISGKFADDFDSGQWGYLTGLWHDVGKYSYEFQKRIGVEPDAHIELIKGRPDHATAGAQHAVKSLGANGCGLAYLIAGHHAGLANGKDDTNSCLSMRLDKKIPDWSVCPSEIGNRK